MLGLRRDLISINNKGEYVWNDNAIEARSYISSKMKKFCSELSFDIMKELPQFRFIDSDMTPKEATPNDYFFICLSPSDIYLFDHDININEFKPKYFLLYNNICQYSIFDTKYLPILKIVPIRQSDSEYITIEFKNEEYIGIQTSHPNYLEFILRSHTGELLNFTNNKESVIVDLSFRKIV